MDTGDDETKQQQQQQQQPSPQKPSPKEMREYNQAWNKAAEIVVILAAFCDGLSKILTIDKTKLEKASHATVSRSVVGRALLTTTVSSLTCLQKVVAVMEHQRSAAAAAAADGSEVLAVATSHLMPAAALLRFGFEQGRSETASI